jgi:regulator of Ty1 transposition protein 103
MAEAIQTAYKTSPPEVQNKIRRVTEVWRTRNVFEVPILDAIDARIDDIDKSKGKTGMGKKTLMGQSLFGSSGSGGGMPKELESLGPLQIAVTKESIAARPVLDTAQAEFDKLNAPDAVLPKPPVYAARLSSLMKCLAAAELSVSASIKARNALITDLERILAINKTALAKDEETYARLDTQKVATENKKREVEDGIIRGLSGADPLSNHPAPVMSSKTDEEAPYDPTDSRPALAGVFLADRPEIESLTDDEGDFISHYDPGMDTSASALPGFPNPTLAAALAELNGPGAPAPDYSDFLPSAPVPNPRVRSASGSNGISAKRRKTSHGADDHRVPDFGDMGIEGMGGGDGGSGIPGLDHDVDELIRQGVANAGGQTTV